MKNIFLSVCLAVMSGSALANDLCTAEENGQELGIMFAPDCNECSTADEFAAHAVASWDHGPDGITPGLGGVIINSVNSSGTPYFVNVTVEVAADGSVTSSPFAVSWSDTQQECREPAQNNTTGGSGGGGTFFSIGFFINHNPVYRDGTVTGHFDQE